MKTTVTYVKRYFKATSIEVEIPDNLTDEQQIDFLDGIEENWEQVHDASLDFEDQEILIN